MYSLYLLFNAYLVRFHVFMHVFSLYFYWDLNFSLGYCCSISQGAMIAP